MSPLFPTTATWGVAVVVAMAMALQGRGADGCSCVGPLTVYNRYYPEWVTNVFRGKVIRELQEDGCDPDEDQLCKRFFEVKRKRTFKGCKLPKKVILSTSANSAQCGVSLSTGGDYLFYTSKSDVLFDGEDTYSIGLCGGSGLWENVDKKSRKFLVGREYTCGKERFCANGKHKRLLLKCATGCAPCSDETAVCDASLCRGCGGKGSFYYNPETFERLTRRQCRA